MKNIYFFKKKLLITTENYFEPILEYLLRVTFLQTTEKLCFSADNFQFQEKMILQFGENIKIKFLQNSCLIGDFSILSGHKYDYTYVSYDNLNNYINLSQKNIFGNQDNIDDLTDMILEELSYLISTQVNNVETVESEGVFFADLVLDELRADPLPYRYIEGETFIDSEPDEDHERNTFSENIFEKISPSFVKSQGQIQWQDSSGNLHPLPIT